MNKDSMWTPYYIKVIFNCFPFSVPQIGHIHSIKKATDKQYFVMEASDFRTLQKYLLFEPQVL